MPVGRLLCEGEDQSPDMRVLFSLVSDRVEIDPIGSKYGMGTRVISRREVTPGTVVAAIRDRDWDRVVDRQIVAGPPSAFSQLLRLG